MIRKRIISLALSAFMLAGCVSCLSFTAFAAQTVTKTFKDDFNKGVTAETANGSTGEYYRTDGLYYESNGITGFLKTQGLNTAAKYYDTPHLYAALTSNILKDSTGSAYITYYAEEGITGFNFSSRFSGSNTPNDKVWDSSILVDTSGNVYANKQPLIYVSENGEDWVNPYNNELGYKISYYWPSVSNPVYSGWNSMACKSVSIPDGMKYMKIVFPYMQWLGATQIDDLEISYNYTMPDAPLYTVEKANRISDFGKITLDFSLTMKESTLTADKFTVKNADTGENVTVSDVYVFDDNKKCDLIFENPLSSATSYSVSVSEDVLSEEDVPVPEDMRIAEFCTMKSAGSYTFTDPLKDLSCLADYKGVKLHSDFSGFDKKFIGSAQSDERAYATYLAEGDITSVQLDFVGYGGVLVNGSADRENPLNFYYSFDGKEFTKIDKASKKGASEVADWAQTNISPSGATRFRYNIGSVFPSGARYFKVEFPLSKGVTGASINNIEIGYTIGQSGALISNAFCESTGSYTDYIVNLKIINDIDEDAVTPDMFSIANSGINCIGADYYEDTKLIRLSFDSAFEFGREYVLEISEDLTDIYGYSVNEDSRELKFTFEKPEPILVKDMSFGKNSLEKGSLSCNLDIKSEYAGGRADQSIMVLMILYQGERIADADCERKTVTVGSSEDFTVSVNIGEVTENTKVRLYILDSWQNLELLYDEVEF